MEIACKEAMEQIKQRSYEEVFDAELVPTVYKYGVACKKKHCRIKLVVD